MPLSPFQRGICRLLAANRIRSGDSYLAGGATLNELLQGSRLSRDLDLFHDTAEALAVSWDADRVSLIRGGYEVAVIRERPTFVEAVARQGNESVVIQWAQDSAYRFFPLLTHEEIGLVLHPFDLATSKVLALVGRVEPRDFVDTLTCDRQVQPLGFLAWAASGKDPGFSPAAILERAASTVRYTDAELAGLDFEGAAPHAAELSATWRTTLSRARAVVELLPAEHAGMAVLTRAGTAYRGEGDELRVALSSGELVFHSGRIGGVLPNIRLAAANCATGRAGAGRRYA
jgi:hypothetical protein